MSITLTQTGAFRNPYPNPNNDEIIAAHKAIGQLDYADIFRGAKSKVRQDPTFVMRVDVQGDVAPAGKEPLRKNIQVQRNGVNGQSTVAAVLVSTSTLTADPANRVGVARWVRKALCLSLSSQQEVVVTGAIAATKTAAQKAADREKKQGGRGAQN